MLLTAYREFRYSKMTEKWCARTSTSCVSYGGVCLDGIDCFTVFSPSSLLVSLGGSPRSIENLTILGVIEDILLLKQ